MNNKIVLAGSNFLLREGLKALFAETQYSIGAEILHARDLFDKVSEIQPDLVIINFCTYGFTVDDILKIHSAHSKAKVLAITERPSQLMVTTAIEYGVLSYLMTDCDRDEILDAVKCTLEGEAFFCGKILNQAVAPAPDNTNEENVIPAFTCNGVRISAREAEIISLVADGLTNKQIAEQLFLSAHTVITHRKNIMNKLGLNNTAGLVLFAIKQNIISPNKFLFSS